ncbi:conserved Plasmodium protein, unknown function [Plasmodium malariae]|uniref:Uncharacterized protein n=1 Tax=Plasmodium malariae TaxID=5858 RepID=A0A1C3L0S3_PLAMA|nr:conserved Plasmodium protein, unknown function [Plasmodium malariae]
MTVNTSLYRNNLDNKYNCNNTAFDYIKNKDNTIKFFASPKKIKKKNSIKKSINNSDCFYFLNSSMINSDNIYNNNNFNRFDSKGSMDCNNSASIYNKSIFIADNVRNKEEVDSKKKMFISSTKGKNFDKISQNFCGDLEYNESKYNKDNIYEFKSSTSAYNINKKNNSNDFSNNRNNCNDGSTLDYVTRNNDNNITGNNYNNNNTFNMIIPSDTTEQFHMNKNKNKYAHNSNAKMDIFSNIKMDETLFYKSNENDSTRNNASGSSNNPYGDNSNNIKDHKDHRINIKNNNNNSSDTAKEFFGKNNFIDINFYDRGQMKFVSKDFNNLQSGEFCRNEFENNRNFQTMLTKPNFSEQNQDKEIYNMEELKEKYINVCKEQRKDGDNNNYHFFECSYEKYNDNNYGNDNNNSKMMVEYVHHNKNVEGYTQKENKKKKKNENITYEFEKNNEIMMKNMGGLIPDHNILKLTQKNIDRKNVLEEKGKSNTSLYSKKKDTDVSLSTFNSKRLSNSNISVNENRKIRRYTKKMCQEDDNISFQQSEKSKGKNNKESVETPSSQTSETSMSSAFKMATSVFKKLF